MLLAIVSAGRFVEENEGKTEADHLSSSLTSLFSMLAETPEGERPQTLTWQYYVPYVENLQAKNLTSTFAYAVLADAGVASAVEWARSHADELRTLHEWVDSTAKEPPPAIAY